MTRKIYKKEKIQKIDKAACFYTLKRFVLFFSRLIYTFQLFVFSRCTINYRKQKNVNENVYFNCYKQNYVATNYLKSKKRIA